jgi:DNA polymerase-3 subunit delta'
VNATTELDVWADVVGQDTAVHMLRALAEQPVHAYLLVGPHGSGKRAIARAFAATLLAQVSSDPERAARLALQGRHPDLIEVVPEGNLFRGGQQPDTEVSQLLREAALAPIEGARKVLVADHVHAANPEAVGRMLKSIEEPAASIVWVLLSEEVPAHQATIASRCVRVDLHPVPRVAVAQRLEAEGIAPERAELAAAAAGGDLQRARLLANDDRLVERTAFWASIPSSLDGSGTKAAALVDEALARTEEVLEPLKERQADELTALAAIEEEYGARGGERRRVVERHKREARQLRTDELLHGLATLAGRYRDEVAAERNVAESAAAMQRCTTATRELVVRNANERLLLLSLLLSLPRV